DVFFQITEVGDAPDTPLQLVFEFPHVLLGQLKILARSGQVASGLLRSDQTASGLLPGSTGIFEVTANGHLNRLAGVRQPQHDKQCHHGRDEVGIGDLPGAAVMTAMAAFFLDDDDGWCRHEGVYPAAAASAAGAGTSLAPRQASSTSWNEGRT